MSETKNLFEVEPVPEIKVDASNYFGDYGIDASRMVAFSITPNFQPSAQLRYVQAKVDPTHPLVPFPPRLQQLWYDANGRSENEWRDIPLVEIDEPMSKPSE